jgi:hypothetical protein
MEESGEVVGVFNAGKDVKSKLVDAVSRHFDVASVGLGNPRDFNMPFDYEQPYKFILFKGKAVGEHATDEEEWVTLVMTYAPIY